MARGRAGSGAGGTVGGDAGAQGTWERTRRELPNVWALSWPVTVSALVQILLPVVDTVLIGRVSQAALAGLGVAATVYVLATVVLNGAGLAIKVTVTHRHGGGEPDEVGRVTDVGLALITALGVLLAVAVVALSGPLSALLAPSQAVAEGAAGYLRITAVSIPALGASITLLSAFSGVGRTRVMLVHALVLGGVNLVIGVGLVFGAGWGLHGVAVATVVAVFAGLGFLVAHGRGRLAAVVPFGHWRLPRADWRAITAGLWRIGWPEMVLLGVGFASPVILVGMLAAQGEAAVAAFRVLDNVFMLLFAVVTGFHSGVTILTGQSIGAGDFERVATVQRAALLLCGGVVAVITGPLVLASEPVIGWTTGDPEITAAILPALGPSALAIVAIGGGVVVSGVLRAAGDTRYIMATELLGEYGLVIPLTWALVVRGDFGLAGLGWAWVASWWTILLLKWLRCRAGFWRTARL